MANLQQLSNDISVSEVLAGLVEEGQLGLAQRWAATLPQNFQTCLVTHCVASDRLKEAVKLVRHLNLQQVWPATFLPLTSLTACCRKYALCSGRACLMNTGWALTRDWWLHVCNEFVIGPIQTPVMSAARLQ